MKEKLEKVKEEKNGKKNKVNKKKSILSIWNIVIIIVIVIIVVAIINFNSKINNKEKTLKLGLEDIGKLSTQKCNMTILGNVEEYRKIFNIKIPFTESREIFSYNVSVDGYLDFSKIEIDVDDKKKRIEYKLPHAQIDNVVVDYNSFEKYIDDESLFSRIDLSENNEEMKKLIEKAKNDALKSGLLEQAEKNAEKLLISFAKANSFKDYEVVFKYK